MQLTETTVDGWTGVIADLTAKRQAALEHLEQLRTQKRDLALEAAMGGADAKRQLDKANAELRKLAFEIDDWDSAIARAEAEKLQAEQSAATEAETDRQRQITEILGQYYAEVRAVDDGLRLLAERFEKSKQLLDRAEALMNSAERTPLQQLRTQFGPTLAAAHFGLGPFIELGRAASHIAHRKPLAEFAWGFVDRWLQKEAKEETND